MLTQTAAEYINLLLDEPVTVAHWLGFDKLTDLHNDWIKSFLTAEDDQTLLGHRGSYKTTALSVAIAIHIILLPNRNISFLRKTDDDVVEIIEQVKKILVSDTFAYLTKKIYGYKIKLLKSNGNEITTNLVRSARGSVQLLGTGIKTSITGKHFDLVITDDIVTLRDRISRAEREYTKQVYMELQNIKNRDGRIINTGTPWHKEDAISVLMPNVQKFDCYSTGLISREELEDIRGKTAPSLFAANYELTHIASEGALFSTSPTFTSNEALIYNGMTHIDAAYGGDDGNALTLARRVGDKLYVLGKHREGHIDKCLSEFLTIKEHFRCGSVMCEDNGDKGYLAKEIRRSKHTAITYHEHMNKYIKIATYLKKWWSNIVFLDGTDPDYINQIMDYTEDAEHDDSPDGLSVICRKISQPNAITTSSLKLY